MTKTETLVHGARGGDQRPLVVDIDGNAIVDIILSYGAPPSVAAPLANAIIDYLAKLHRDAGAQGLQ